MTHDRSKKGLSCGVVALGMLVLAAAAAAAGAWGYFRFLKYEHVAARHIPADSIAAARVDVEEGILYDPVRQHLLPVLTEAIRRESPDALMRRFEHATGVGRLELREIVVARGAEWSDWTLVFSGLFPKEGVIPRLHEFLKNEGTLGWKLDPGAGVLVHVESGHAIGQAEDGAIVLASTRSRLEAALPAEETSERLGLDADAPAAFAASAQQLREIAGHPAALLAPGLSELGHLARVRGTLNLGGEFQVQLFLEPLPGKPAAELRSGVERLLGALRLMARWTKPGGVAGERTVLERTVIEPATDNFVAISSTWTREEADRGARSLAEALRSWIGPPRSAPP